MTYHDTAQWGRLAACGGLEIRRFLLPINSADCQSARRLNNLP